MMFEDCIRYEKGEGGLDRVRLIYRDSTAVIYLQGAQVVEYSPGGSDNLLWVSQSSNFEAGKAIRGGIPICWPWFGAHPRDDRPQHGFARQSMFHVAEGKAGEHSTSILLRLDSSAAPFEEWGNKLEFEVEIRLSDSLWMEARTKNISKEAVAISDCLHSYFAVQDARQTRLPELHNKRYLDKTLGFEEYLQAEPFNVAAEVDRVYLDAPNAVCLTDSLASRRIDIETWGFGNLVVWNPWQEAAEKMRDFDDAGYLKMICVEPANALAESVSLSPGETHSAGQQIDLLAE